MDIKNLKAEIKNMLFEAIQSDKIYNWLEKIKYFDAPASANHHGAYPGGLAEHCYMVAVQLQDLTERLDLKWSRKASPVLVGLLHDVCKVDEYRMIDKIGNTYKYEKSTDSVFSHHAEKSISLLLCGGIELTEEEIVCIRWHMGAYTTETSEWNFLNRAIRKYNNVLWAHTADMIASQIIGI